MLILVLLMSTLFTGIALRMHNRMQELPDYLTNHQLKRDTENVSDYALRYSIAFAVDRINGWVKKGYDHVRVLFDGNTETEGNIIRMPVFMVGNSRINSIDFTHIGIGPNKEMRFRAATNVTGNLMGQSLNYPAELAFNYFKTSAPNCYYYQMDQSQFPGGKLMYDTSGQNPRNDSYPNGNNLMTAPTPGDEIGGWKIAYWCDKFESAAYTPNAANGSMEVDSAFTLVLFFKPDKRLESKDFSLVWMPSAEPKEQLDEPSLAIWYKKDDGNLHFSVGLDGGHKDNLLEVLFPFRNEILKYPEANSHSHYRGHPWIFVALTFDNGELKAYYNGLPAKNCENPVYGSSGLAYRSKYGVSLGSRVTKVDKSNYKKCEYDRIFAGVMTNIGLYDRALSETEIWDFYQYTDSPAKVSYIRD